MKTKIVRDIPIGVLLIVLYLWCVATISYLANGPGTLHLIGIILLSVLGWRLLKVGIDVIFGIIIEDKNAKE